MECRRSWSEGLFHHSSHPNFRVPQKRRQTKFHLRPIKIRFSEPEFSEGHKLSDGVLGVNRIQAENFFRTSGSVSGEGI